MKQITFVLLIALFTGCISPKQVPDDLLNEEKMAKAMHTLLKAEEITRVKGLQKDSSTVMYLNHYKPLALKKLDITVALFDSSYVFYTDNPIIFEKVMEICKTTLKAELDSLEEVQTKKEEAKKKAEKSK